MSEPRRPPELPYELRAPVSGAGLRDPRSALLIWGVASILLGLVVSVLLIRGQIRLLTLIVLVFLGLASLAPRRGIYILTVFLPFMYALRRSVLSFEEFSGRDPILLFPVITAAAMFGGVVIFQGPRILYYLKRSAAFKTIALLLIWFTLQMFNPLQGNLLVGLAGAIFFIVPILWMPFGLLISDKDVSRLFKIVLAVGVITSIYGLHQHYFGLSEVEEYAMKAKGFYKLLTDGKTVRIMSTFSSLVDFSRYLTISGLLAFAYFWRNKRLWVFMGLLLLQMHALFFTASRTSFLVLFFSITMLILVGGRNGRLIMMRGLMALVLVLSLYAYMYQFDPQRAYGQQFSTDPFVVHTISGISQPTRESTFQMRLGMWSYILKECFTSNPIGYGLGSTTQAAAKFEGQRVVEADSYFFESFYGSGMVAPILLITIAIIVLKDLLRMILRSPEKYIYKICFAIMCGAFLSSVFGVTLRDSISGPFIWMLIGWLVKEQVDAAEDKGAVSMRPVDAAA